MDHLKTEVDLRTANDSSKVAVEHEPSRPHHVLNFSARVSLVVTSQPFGPAQQIAEQLAALMPKLADFGLSIAAVDDVRGVWRYGEPT